MILMKVAGLGFDPSHMSPIVLLQDEDDRHYLPIWIGMFEAAAIAMELQAFKSPRPMTHDLLISMLTKLNGVVNRVTISSIQEGTFYATIDISQSVITPGVEEKKTPVDDDDMGSDDDFLRALADGVPSLDLAPDPGTTTNITLDARPSDAIAIAVRTNTAIFVSESVMQKARMVNADKDAEDTEKFKDFINTITPEDFSEYLDSR